MESPSTMYTLGKQEVDTTTGRPVDCGDSIHRSNVIQRVVTRSDGQGGGYRFLVEPLEGDDHMAASEWKRLADLYPSSRIHVVNYEIVIRNWTSDYLHVKPFTLTKGTNPETAAYCYATNPHAETGLSFHGTIPDDSPQTLTWLLNPEPFELDEEGKPSIPVASSPTQTIDVCVPQLIKDQPWLLDEIIFNFTETEVFISYFLRVRNHMMEFLPNGQLWDGMAYLHNGHSIEEANSKRTENVENPFLLHQDQGYGIIVSNRTDKNLKISDFPSWSLSPNCRWTDTPTDETMRPFSRISTWNVHMPESEPDRCFELNWKIVDGDSQDGPPAVIRAGRQVCPLPELDQIRQHNEIYAINFIWDGDQLQVAYTVVQGSTLVDMLPDMSIAPHPLISC